MTAIKFEDPHHHYQAPRRSCARGCMWGCLAVVLIPIALVVLGWVSILVIGGTTTDGVVQTQGDEDGKAVERGDTSPRK